MGELFKKYMLRLPKTAPSAELRARVIAGIEAFEATRLRIRIILFSAATLACAGIFVETALYAWKALAQSGFWQYVSLLTSDADALASFWKELAVSLAASIPITAFIIVLLSGTGLLWSFFALLKNARGRITMQHA